MNFYWVELFASYDNDGAGDGAGAGSAGDAGASSGSTGDAGAGGGAPAASAPNQQGAGTSNAGSGNAGGTRTFSQDEVNKFLAEDRRKHQEKYSSLETSYQELLSNQNLGQEERDRLQKELEDLQARHRTKEQQIAYERKQEEEKYTADLKEARSAAEIWEKRYTESTIHQALQSAAIKHEAFNAEQVIVQLRGATELVEAKDAKGQPTGDLTPMVTMTVKNEDSGVSERLQMTPDEAVEYMKKNPEQWGNFFRNNIREGIGSANATDGANIGSGNVDHSRLNDEQWFKLRKENPSALGLDYQR